MQRRFMHLAFVAFLLAGLSGCVQETVNGTTKIYTYELWVPLVVLIAGLVATPAGWFLRQSSSRFAWALLISGPIAALGFAPSLFLDRAAVTPEAFTVRTGIWGMTAVHEVKFSDLRQVRYISEETVGRRGRKNTNYYFMCERKDGTSAKIPVGNNVVEAAAPAFIAKVLELNIALADQT